MEIAGKYREHYYIIRCCEEGKWQIRENSSGMISCRHTGWQTAYDYLDPRTLKEVTDPKILEEVESSDGYKLYEHRFNVKGNS